MPAGRWGWRRSRAGRPAGSRGRRAGRRTPSLRSTATSTTSRGQGTPATRRPASGEPAADLGLDDHAVGAQAPDLAHVAVERLAVGADGVADRQHPGQPPRRHDRRPVAVVIGQRAQRVVEAVVGATGSARRVDRAAGIGSSGSAPSSASRSISPATAPSRAITGAPGTCAAGIRWRASADRLPSADDARGPAGPRPRRAPPRAAATRTGTGGPATPRGSRAGCCRSCARPTTNVAMPTATIAGRQHRQVAGHLGDHQHHRQRRVGDAAEQGHHRDDHERCGVGRDGRRRRAPGAARCRRRAARR